MDTILDTSINKAERPPLSQLIIYAIGQLGWSLAAFGAANLLLYFYMPPEASSEVEFPTFIFQGAILGVITVIGIINFGGRIFDAITDPLIASYSDRLESKFGKRKTVMAIGILPFVILSILVFYPISADVGNLNTYWLLGCIFLFYLAMTVYVVPYTALISELGHVQKDRLLISTLISVTYALGFLIGGSAYALQAYFEQTMPPVEAFQTAIIIFAVIAFICMLVPILFLKEKKYCQQDSNSNINVFDAVKSVFKNKNFRYFTYSDLMYWLALTFMQLGVSYYITVLMQLEKSYASLFLTIGFLFSFLLYIPVNFLANRYGKKPILIVAFCLLSSLFFLAYFAGRLPMGLMPQFYMLAILSGIPLACFGILPNVIIADVIYDHEQKTGFQQAAMFFATRNFMMKLGVTLANLIFPSLLLLGKSIENPLGIQLSALCAAFFCLLGLAFFLKYDLKDV